METASTLTPIDIHTPEFNTSYKFSDIGIFGAIVIALSVVFSAIGFTNILIRLFYICTPIPKFQKWWRKNTGRDLLIDQFSWSSLVVSACIAPVNFLEVPPYYKGYGSDIMSLLNDCKRFVIDWFSSDPDTYEKIKYVFWVISIVALALKIFCCCCLKKGGLSSFILLVVTFVQSVCSVLGIVLLPLIFHCVGKMDAHSTSDYFSIFFTILLFMTQVGSFHGNCCYGIIASFVVIFLPVSLSLTIGINKTAYKDVLTMALVFVIVLSALTAYSTYLGFFYHTKNKNWRWKISMIITFIIKGVSIACGLVFLFILRFAKLNKESAGFVVFLWLIWVLAPFFEIIPMIVAAKTLFIPGTGTFKKLLN